MNILCICSYYKGMEYLIRQARMGNRVFLVTSEKRKHEAWPSQALAETYYLPEEDNSVANLEILKKGIGWLLQTERVDMITALDDFDVEKAACLRSFYQIPGMSVSEAQLFRDKLAMRLAAKAAGLPVPRFHSLFNDQEIHRFIQEVPGPWVIKPRSQASASGIRKVHSYTEIAAFLQEKGEERVDYLIEEFLPGRVFHVDSLCHHGQIVFENVCAYLETPLRVAHEGGIFQTVTIPEDAPERNSTLQVNRNLLKIFCLANGASHSEFIQADRDGQIYFLETSCRVGGAHIAELVEAATGINLWREWAAIDHAFYHKVPYLLPDRVHFHAGLTISLARMKEPDMGAFQAEELFWTLKKEYHVGLITRSIHAKDIPDRMRRYASIIKDNYHASAPAKDKPTD